MDGFSSECSSGCESGWTMYLDQSAASSPNAFKRNIGDEEGGFLCEEYKPKDVEEEEDEEDLSMVSDASSGPPPHLHEDDQDYYDNDQYHHHHHHRGCFYSASALPKKSDKRQKIKLSSPTTQHHRHHHSLLDDTASSPVFNLPKQISRENAIDTSQGFSATHFKGRSAFQKHFGYLQSSMPGKPTSANPVACRKENGSGRW